MSYYNEQDGECDDNINNESLIEVFDSSRASSEIQALANKLLLRFLHLDLYNLQLTDEEHSKLVNTAADLLRTIEDIPKVSVEKPRF
jgi:hypothetical protein